MTTTIKASELKVGDEIKLNAPYQNDRWGTVKAIEDKGQDTLIVTVTDPLNRDLAHIPMNERQDERWMSTNTEVLARTK